MYFLNINKQFPGVSVSFCSPKCENIPAGRLCRCCPSQAGAHKAREIQATGDLAGGHFNLAFVSCSIFFTFSNGPVFYLAQSNAMDLMVISIFNGS